MQHWSLPTRHLAREVRVYDTLDSTNALALTLADDPALDGLAILARHQSAGRGQQGRAWLAPAESSVLLSLLLFLPEHLRRPPLLTAWAAVSVSDLVQKLSGDQTHIKWPNDVYLKGKKICGILIEQRNQAGHSPSISSGDRDTGQRMPATVVGIGLNVRQAAAFFADADLPLGGSLFSQTGRLHEWEPVARELLLTLDGQMDALRAGRCAGLESSWRERLGLLGKQVRAATGAVEHLGCLTELSFTAVVLQQHNGATLRLAPESVRQLAGAERLGDEDSASGRRL